MYVCRFAHGGDTFPLRTTSLLEGSSGLQEAYTKNLSKWGQFFYHNMLVSWNDTMPSFMIFRRVVNSQKFKKPVSQCYQPSHDAHMFEFHTHLLHGTYKFTQGHTCDISNNFGALEPVLVVRIGIIHIKCPETQLMYKKAKRTRIIPKFSMVLLFGLICQCKKIKVGGGSVHMLFRTRRWHVPSRNHEPSWGKLRFARSLHQSLSQFGQKNYRSMLVPCHDTMPSFMIFRHVFDLQELNNQVSQSFRASHDAQMFEFHSHLLHET